MSSQRVRLLSWNIDMDTPPIPTRARALLRQIRALAPDVVALQEVTPETLPLLQKALQPPAPAADAAADAAAAAAPAFDLHVDPAWPDALPYFAVLFTRAGLFAAAPAAAAARFRASRMGRGYVLARGALACGARAAFATSHLESLRDGAALRKAQLADVLALLREDVAGGAAAVFAGDTNLREAEVPAREVCKAPPAAADGAPRKRRRVAGPPRFSDAWLAAGADPMEKFTWDMKANDNLEFDDGFKPAARYDRVFVLGGETGVEVKSWKLVGKERLPCGKFISDHWGVCVDLEFRAAAKEGDGT